MKRFLTAFLLLPVCSVFAQFAPQAGIPGSDAVHKSSSLIKGWADRCTVKRGWLNIADPGAGYVTAGDSSQAIGPANNTIVSLGDNGSATLTFSQPLYNGPGADFAVFENGFADPADPEQAFLELAFVEVSSDGVHFFPFPAISNVPDTAQIAGAGTYMNARLLNNLAGKYIGNYGTPFDLNELAGISGLDINNIIQVRISDVIGSIGDHASLDKNGHKINDPYPTDFPTGGFDLDAVAAINLKSTAVNETYVTGLSIYPNPATDVLYIEYNARNKPMISEEIILTDVSGRRVVQTVFNEGKAGLSLNGLPAGLYYLIINDVNGNKWTQKISKL